MKKFILTSLIFAMCCCLVGCKKEKDPEVPPVDNVESVVVCSEFNNETFYVGDEVDLNNYTVIITYESGQTETKKLSSFGISVLDTTSVGAKTLNLTYKEKDFTINYNVLAVVPISAMYKGNALEFYRDEGFDFSSVKVSVLYNNGTEGDINLTEFTKSNIDYSLSNETKSFHATYQGVSVSINYTVTNRPIEVNVDYNFNDTLNIFNDEGVKIRFSEDVFILHNNNVENTKVILSQTANSSVFNKYWTIVVYNNLPVKLYFYLVNDTIYCELIEQ